MADEIPVGKKEVHLTNEIVSNGQVSSRTKNFGLLECELEPRAETTHVCR
jgi:hypothetical protein